MKIVAVTPEEFIKSFPDTDIDSLAGCTCFYSSDKDFGCIRDNVTYNVSFKVKESTQDLTVDEESWLLTILAGGESDALERASAYEDLESNTLHNAEVETVKVGAEKQKSSGLTKWKVIALLGGVTILSSLLCAGYLYLMR